MKKLFLMLIMSAFALFVNAQNYSSSSQFSDNWEASLQVGEVTKYSKYFSGHTAMTPTITVAVSKYVNPWLGFGIDARTAIGTGTIGRHDGVYHNTHTKFDMVNISGIAKINLTNIVAYNGTRRFFEPVPYIQLGWGHTPCQDMFDHNYMTFRAGSEFNFNFTENRAWGIVFNPSIVWGGVRDMRLNSKKAYPELNLGIVYHFKTSNGTHGWERHSCPKPRIVTETVTKTIIEKVPVTVENTINDIFRVGFDVNSAELTREAKKVLDRVPTNCTVHITASASPEGSHSRNAELIVARAEAVARYLVSRGVRCTTGISEDARQAIITVTQR